MFLFAILVGIAGAQMPASADACDPKLTMSIPDFAYTYLYEGVFRWMNDTSQPFGAPYLNRAVCLPSRITGFRFTSKTGASTCKVFESQTYVLWYTGSLIRWLATPADASTLRAWEILLLHMLPGPVEPTGQEIVCLATHIGTLLQALLSITVICCLMVVFYIIFSWHVQKRRDEVQMDRDNQLADAIDQLAKKKQ